jgi:hypothetical protein
LSGTKGDYFIKNASNGKYLTNDGASPFFDDRSESDPTAQIWTITKDGTRYKIVSKADNRFLNESGVFSLNPYYPAWNTCALHGVDDGDWYAIQNGGNAGTDYWTISTNGTINGKGATTMTGFPFEIVPYQPTGISNLEKSKHRIYPNPASDRLIVNIASNNSEQGIFTIYSIDGKQMKNIPCTAEENRLYISAFPKGLYLGILKINGLTETFKIIKR